MRSFLRTICSLFMAMMLCLPAVFTMNAAAGNAEVWASEETQNLLVNPDWESGMDGWFIMDNNRQVRYNEHDCLSSIVYQDIPVEDYMYGKAVKLTGGIAVADEDTTQEAAELSLVMCGSDGNGIEDENGELLYEEHVTAEDTVMTECEIIMEIPEEAAFIRVYMQIWKQEADNYINFSNLSLELTDAEKQQGFEDSGFVRRTSGEENEQGTAADPGTATDPGTTTGPGTTPARETAAEQSASGPAVNPSEATGEYTRLEYIAADGTQYIDTGYYDTTGTIIEYRAEWNLNAKGNYDGYMVGARGRDGNGRNGGYYDGWNEWILGYGSSYEVSDEPAFIVGKAYDVRSSTVAGDAWLEVDGIRIAENTDVRGLSTSPIMIFTTESQLSDELNTCGRIYYARIYDHYGIPVRDYVPCVRNADGAVGMFDLVENRFYGNDGTGEFRSGPVLDIPLYESEGQQAAPPSVTPETETDETGNNTGRQSENESPNGHGYKIIQEAMYWEDAWDYCTELGGHLVTINSAQEQAYLEKILKDADVHGKLMIGLGSPDRDLRNAFEWITGEPLEYTNWGEGEPDGGQPVCILSTEEISGSHFHIRPYQWDDDEYAMYFFICEWEPETDAAPQIPADTGSAATDDGQIRSLVEQGKGYYYGTGPEGYNKEKAWQCFSQAARLGSGEGWYYYGNLFMNSIEENRYGQALDCYENACAYGFDLGLVGQAVLYASGLGVETDHTRAFELNTQAAEEGFAEGYCGLGDLYLSGHGVMQDETAALEYYRMGLDSNDFMWKNYAKCQMAKIYKADIPGIGPDYDQAYDWYMDAANEGYGTGYLGVGNLYIRGQGVEKSSTEAFRWYCLAADHGSSVGMYSAGYMLKNGMGIPQDHERALAYFLQSANLGNADSMYEAGCMYEEGLGTAVDYGLARYWLELALNFTDDADLLETIKEELECME